MGEVNEATIGIGLSPDGDELYVGLDTRIHEFEPGTLERVQVWDTGAPTTGLSVSVDGSLLRFALLGRIHIIDRETGSEIAVLEGPGGADVTILGPPSGNVVQIPLECAC
jgi:hypothetical protein